MDFTVNDGRALQRLLDELGRLPGIGPKSAQRIAYYLLEADAEEARRLAQAILEVKQQVHFCPVCFSYATRDTCDGGDHLNERGAKKVTAFLGAWLAKQYNLADHRGSSDYRAWSVGA